ncbi:MAG: tetratricopeptide repeat protein [Phycisphaerae bacterium]
MRHTRTLRRAVVRYALRGLAGAFCLALAAAGLQGQGALRSVGRGPSTDYLRNLPSFDIERTLGRRSRFTSARDLARSVPPQRTSYLATRGIITRLRRSTWQPATIRDLAPGQKPTALEVVRSIGSLDFRKRGRFARLKETVLALAERARQKEELSLGQVSFGFRQFMYPLPLVDQPDVGYGFFSRTDLVGGGAVDPAVFLDPFTEDVQKSLGEDAFLDMMESLLGNRPPPGGPDFQGLYDTQMAALGNYLFNNGRYRWAGEAWKVLTERDPTNATAARGHGLALMAQRRLRPAAQELRRSLRVTKGWPDAFKVVGSNLQDVFPNPQTLADVREEINAQLEKKADADLAFLLAFLDVFQGRWDEAKERLAGLAPQDEVAKGLLGVLERGAVDESVHKPLAADVRRLAGEVTGLEEPALTAAERAELAQALRQGPDSYKDHMRIGDFRFFMGQFTRAGEAYRHAHKTSPEDPYALFALVHASFANGEFRQAGRYLDKALAIEPDWALFEFRLQEFYGDYDEYERHLKNLERQVELRPDSVRLKFLLAYVYYFSGRFADATDLLAQVLRLEPGFEKADYFLRLARLQG